MPSESRKKEKMLPFVAVRDTESLLNYSDHFPFALPVDPSSTRLAFMRSFEIYFGVKCFLCCVSSL